MRDSVNATVERSRHERTVYHGLLRQGRYRKKYRLGTVARLGRKTLLVELDSGLRSVDIIAGVYGRTVYDIEDVLCGRCEGAKAVVPSPLYPGLSVISAPYEGGAVEAAPP